MFTKILVIVLFQSSAAVIYKLNDSEYALMPPVFHMDNYEECFEDPEGLYCTADFTLVSDEPSPLLTMIQDFTAHTTTHYNHSLLRYNVCIKQTCKKFYEIEKDLGSTLEACLNESLYNNYELKARVSNDFDCSKLEKHPPIDYLDISVAVICAVILLANLCGSICDYFLQERNAWHGVRFLYCFSIFMNWRNFFGSSTKRRNYSVDRMKGLHGVRALFTYFVILGHSFYTGLVLTENPNFIEDAYQIKIYSIIMNGTQIMQVFLVMSSFFLVYNWLVHSENSKPSWKMLPKILLMRWFRLTPSYAVVFALTATWFGRIASGPYWKKLIYNEMTDCRRDWWKHFLYINNYFTGTDCMQHSWYLAADTQLYFMAVIVFLICQTGRDWKVVLRNLFILGMIVPTFHTYFQNLDGVLILSPETSLALFKNNPTMEKVYQRGHTNLTGCVIGMVLGYMIYEWQMKQNGDPKKFQKYRYLHWFSFPLACLTCFSGIVFYGEDPEVPVYINLLYAAFMKPIFGIFMAIFISGIIIEPEGFYQAVFEWRPLTLLGKLSFSAFLLHSLFIKNHVAMQTSLQTSSIPGVFITSCKIAIYSFTAAFFFWMLVEAPFGNLVKSLFVKADTTKKDKERMKQN